MKAILSILLLSGFSLMARNWILTNGVTATGDYLSSGTNTLVIIQNGTNFTIPLTALSAEDREYVAEKYEAAFHARLWVLTNGVVVSGEYVSSGTSTLVIKQHGTNFFIPLTALSEENRKNVAQRHEAIVQARLAAESKQIQLAQRSPLDAEADQMAQAGMIEFTAKLVENFPEEVDGKSGWMDANFSRLDDIAVSRPREFLGFRVKDKNGDFYDHCLVAKTLDTNPNPVFR